MRMYSLEAQTQLFSQSQHKTKTIQDPVLSTLGSDSVRRYHDLVLLGANPADFTLFPGLKSKSEGSDLTPQKCEVVLWVLG